MRRIAVAFALLATILVTPSPARACTCAMGDPRRTLARSDAAFIGTLINHDQPTAEGETSNLGQSVKWRFRIERSVKGNLKGEIEVHAPYDGAACGLGMKNGERTGLLLRRQDGRWESSSCMRMNPDALLRAASPLPPPDGQPPPLFLVGGAFGETRMMFLDQKARTIAYGLGEGSVFQLSVCPRQERAVELVGDRWPWIPFLAIRDLRTFDVVTEIPLPELERTTNQRVPFVQSVSCRNAAGTDLLFLITDGWEPEAEGRLIRLRDGKQTTIHAGSIQKASFAEGSDLAYLSTGPYGRDIASVDLGGGRVRSIASLGGGWTSELAISPDGTKVAGMSTGGPPGIDSNPSGTMFVIDLARRGKLIQEPLGPQDWGEMLWIDSASVVIAPTGGEPGKVRILDANLRVKSEWEGLGVNKATIRDGKMYGFGRQELVAASFPNSPSHQIRTFADMPQTYALAVLSRPGYTPILEPVTEESAAPPPPVPSPATSPTEAAIPQQPARPFPWLLVVAASLLGLTMAALALHVQKRRL